MGTPIPQSLYDRAELLARSHPLDTVAEIMGVGRWTVLKMKRRGWKAVDYSVSRRPVPNDWGIVAPDMSAGELARHYHTTGRMIKRWMREKPVRGPMKPGPKQQSGRRE